MSAHWMFTLGEGSSNREVPGLSKWIASHLKDCDLLVASSIRHMNDLYANGIRLISEFLGKLDEMVEEESRENSILAERLLESPEKSMLSGGRTDVSRREERNERGVEDLEEVKETGKQIGRDLGDNKELKENGSAGEKRAEIFHSEVLHPQETRDISSNPPKAPLIIKSYNNFPLSINSLPLKLNEDENLIRNEIKAQQRITNDQIIIPSSSPTRSTANRESVIFSRHSQLTAPTIPINLNSNKKQADQKVGDQEDEGQEVEDQEDSLQKIQMSIRRYTDVKKQEQMKLDSKLIDSKLSEYNSNNNSSYLLKTPNPLLSTKTPVKTPAFVSLPKREPLNIESSAPRLNRKSFATLSREKRKTNSSSASKNPESVSPMKRNRFPSFVEDLPTTTPAKALHVRSPKTDTQPPTTSLDSSSAHPRSSAANMTTKVLQQQNSLKSPRHHLNDQLLKTENTPKLLTPALHSIRLENIRNKTESISSGSPSPSAKTSPKANHMSNFSRTPRNLSTAPRFMSPTGSSIAKLSSIQKLTDSSIQKSKSKFMTTTLGPNTRLSRYTPKSKQSPMKLKTEKAPEKAPISIPLDTKRIPPLNKKSLVLPKSESKTKQKLVINTMHKKSNVGEETRRTTTAAGSTTASSSSEIKKKLSQEPASIGSTSYKRRQLRGNGVALPEAARPKNIMKFKEAKTTQPIALANLSATPKKIPPTLSIHKDSSSPILPDIASEDEGGIVLKPWAEPSALHQLVVQSKRMNPKEIFGEVSKFNFETYQK